MEETRAVISRTRVLEEEKGRRKRRRRKGSKGGEGREREE